MANYYGVTRTNYFHVKDEAKFRELMAKVESDEGVVDVWDDERDRQGGKLFGFGVYGCIFGIPDDDGQLDEHSYDRLVDGLRMCVADDDAILIFEVGHEKLRYVNGSATIITQNADCEWISICDSAIEIAKNLLGNSQWRTKCDY